MVKDDQGTGADTSDPALESEGTVDPAMLVERIKETSVDELVKLPFYQLNILKNAVFASKGYDFADDRPWLNGFFCYPNELIVDIGARIRKDTPWDLQKYKFPSCSESGDFDEHQEKALANIRIATFRKISELRHMYKVDFALNNEFNSIPEQNGVIWVLGKPLTMYGEYEDEFYDIRPSWRESMRRDLNGYSKLIRLISSHDKIDAMELLGLYAGDIVFLRNIIEAKHGKAFSGVLQWEIGQLIGITNQDPDYDIKKLPVDVQVRLEMLDDIVRKIQRSGLNDIPSALKNRPIQFVNPYYGAAC